MNPVRYYVVLDDEGTQRHPLKAWIRAHPGRLPEDDVNSLTTHQMVARLQKKGWSRQTDYSTHHELVTPPEVSLKLKFMRWVSDVDKDRAYLKKAITEINKRLSGI